VLHNNGEKRKYQGIKHLLQNYWPSNLQEMLCINTCHNFHFNTAIFNPIKVCKICNQEDNMVSLTRRKQIWIGHILRKDPNDIAKEGLFWTPEGKDNEQGLEQPGGGQRKKNSRP